MRARGLTGSSGKGDSERRLLFLLFLLLLLVLVLMVMIVADGWIQACVPRMRKSSRGGLALS